MKIGIDIGGSHIAVGLVDNSGNIIYKREKDLFYKYNDNIKEEIEKTILDNIEKILQNQNIKIEQIDSIGIAAPGEIQKNEIITSSNLNLKQYNIIKALKKYIKIPINLRNDAKCAALCEKKYGSLKPYKTAVFLTIGTGIGGAVIWQNELVTTDETSAFEFGHMIIQKNGKMCKCGKKGCFERYASISELKKNIIKYYKIKKEIEGRQILQFIKDRQKDPDMQKIINQYIDDLCIGISNLINIFQPEVVSIGGSFVYYKDIFLQKMIKKLKEYLK